MNVPIDIAAKTAAELVDIYRERNEQLEQLIREHEETIAFCDQRIYQLEQLCRDMWECVHNAVYPRDMAIDMDVEQRMDALGLLEVEE